MLQDMQAGGCELKNSAATRCLSGKQTKPADLHLLGTRVCTSTAYLKLSTSVPPAPLSLASRKINLDHLF